MCSVLGTDSRATNDPDQRKGPMGKEREVQKEVVAYSATPMVQAQRLSISSFVG